MITNNRRLETKLDHRILTDAEEQKLAKTIQNVRKAYDKLVAGQTLAEYERAQAVASIAREQLVTCNRRLVASIAARYKPKPPLTLDDLIAEGTVGLVHATAKFSPTHARFTTYAGYYIHQAILAFLNSQSLIVIPIYLMDEINEVNRTIKEFMDGTGREPHVDEISKLTGIPTKRVLTTLMARRCRYGQISSIDVVIGEENGSDRTFIFKDNSVPLPSESLEKFSQAKWLGNHLDSALDARAAKIVKLYYGIGYDDPKTLHEVGKIVGVTRERIRQILNKSKLKMRDSINNEL